MKTLQPLIIITLLSVSTALSAQPEWVPWTGVAPANAVAGGTENGNVLYVCRAVYNNVKHPGKVIGENCNIGYGGAEVVLPSFEVLVNNGGVELVWQPVKTATIPAGAIQGGTENGKPLLVGQTTRPDGSVHAGKILPDVGTLRFNYGYGGEEITIVTGFRVLVAKYGR